MNDKVDRLVRKIVGADPNLVPFQRDWLDNTGGMANAIFWLSENWDKDLNAQGDHILADGRRMFWNYSRLSGTLLVHISGSREYWRVTLDKMLHIKDGIEENATIYRPFFQARAYGMSLYDRNQPIVEWLKTREVVVVKNHYPTRVPLSPRHAERELDRLLKAPSAQFPAMDLKVLAGVENTSRSLLTASEATAYCELTKQIQVLQSVKTKYEEHHIHSYTALVDRLVDYHRAAKPEASDEEVRMYFKGLLETEIGLLIAKSELPAAALVRLLYEYVSKGFIELHHADALETINHHTNRTVNKDGSKSNG